MTDRHSREIAETEMPPTEQAAETPPAEQPTAATETPDDAVREKHAVAPDNHVAIPGDEVAGREQNETSERPPHIPQKFWDAERGEIRTETLLKSYAELERRLTRSLPLPADAEDTAAVRRIRQALGWPESPDEYEITPAHPALEVDPELNRRLHEAGFTEEQAQLVYDLAAERVLPAIDAVAETFRAEQERQRLEQHFGGSEAFESVARQLKSWAEAHLEPEVYESLSGSYQGVLALHQMMQAQEPPVVGETGGSDSGLGEERLYEMMRDPRYWRDRDPEFIARVTEGFQQLFSE